VDPRCETSATTPVAKTVCAELKETYEPKTKRWVKKGVKWVESSFPSCPFRKAALAVRKTGVLSGRRGEGTEVKRRIESWIKSMSPPKLIAER
jgi:hypothetical protein